MFDLKHVIILLRIDDFYSRVLFSCNFEIKYIFKWYLTDF